MRHHTVAMTCPDPFSERVRQCAVRLLESQEAAVAGLYDLTATRLLRYATTITRNQHDAEDALQAALVKVAIDCRSLVTAQQPWPYLLKVVRNECLQVVRRRKRWLFFGDLRDLLTVTKVDQQQDQDQIRDVWRALRDLPTSQSEVVVLKIWEQLTFAQIGDMLEISPATAASRYRYALQKLETSIGVDSKEPVR